MNEIVDPSLPSADIGLIKRMIPHRYPFLFVDKVFNLVAGEGALGIKNVTINEPYFTGHFPDKPVMPGVSIVEAMAQTAAVLVVFSTGMIDRDLSVYLMSIDNARFRHIVEPGDVLFLPVTVLRGRGRIWKFSCEARVEGKVVASADITAAWQLNEAGELN